MSFDIFEQGLSTDTALITLRTVDRARDVVGADGTNPAQVEVYSPGSPEGYKAQSRFDKHAQLRTFRLMRGVDPDPEEMEREKVARLVSFTKGFVNFDADAQKFYTDPRAVDFHDQIAAFIDKRANFTRGSSKS